MTQTAIINKTKLNIDRVVFWDDNAKYDGSVYITSDKGASYLGFILKGQNKVAVYKMSNSGGRSFKGYIEIELPVRQSEAEMLQAAIAENYGIGAECEVSANGIFIKVKTTQSASTLLRKFRHHKATVHANDFLNFTLFVPIKPNVLMLNGK